MKQEEVKAKNMKVDRMSGDYLNAEFVKERNLTTVRIVDEGVWSEFEQKGELKRKLCVGIN
ncbi:MAG: hypothetical protein J4F28_08490, partial [Nitrosopumilaceae archaeon]|nr:hypothetical protein [Nitrosopumilaceae archaeon]